MTDRTTTRAGALTARAALLAALVALALSLPVTNLAQQVLDICGCANTPGLQPFDSEIPATHPPGTVTSGVFTIPLPPDGVLRFSSFRYARNQGLTFSRNAANTPVTILVAGDFSLIGAAGCCPDLNLSGSGGSGGSSVTAGVGGLGGPGGFRGGDGAFQAVNFQTIGGTGFGPGGGAGGTLSTPANTRAGGGAFFGVPELLPLVGGSGGGGGASLTAGGSCSGGGGGGGGGALLIAANGTVRIQDIQVFADGVGGGGPGNGGCANFGGNGSGGAIRVVGSRIINSGSASGGFFARGGGGDLTNGTTNGRIRLESVDSSAQTFTGQTQPGAIRLTGPSPIVNPIQPTVTITGVGNLTPPAGPQGWLGAIDVVLPAPGDTVVSLQTTGVPSGTTVEVKVKPRMGAAPTTATVALTNCNASGVCTAATNFNLAAGAYVIEARATFQVAAP